MKNIINWRLFFLLLFLSLFGVVAVFPYVSNVQRDIFETIQLQLPILMLLQILQSAVIFSIVIFIGMLTYKKIGFSLPILESFVSKKIDRPQILSIVKPSLIFGLFTGVMIALADYIFSLAGIKVVAEVQNIPVWQKFLASFYGGITEEILLRFFLMTVLVWVGMRFIKNKKNSSLVIWMAIAITSIIFGLGHLPVTASITELTPQIILRGILLNSIGGFVFGWLYWKKGLESAMVAHFATDIMLLLVIPFLITM